MTPSPTSDHARWAMIRGPNGGDSVAEAAAIAPVRTRRGRRSGRGVSRRADGADPVNVMEGVDQ